jgi:hypothetical protein
MTSAVQPIHSVDLKPVDPLQSSMPARLDTLSRAEEVTSGASAIQSISEREVAFSKLMATSSPAESAATQQTAGKWYEFLPSSPTTNTQKADENSTTGTSSSQQVDKVFNSLDKDTKAAINDLLATLKKELTAAEFQALKVGWAGQNGSERELALTYYFYTSQVVQDGLRMLNRLEDDLKNA